MLTAEAGHGRRRDLAVLLLAACAVYIGAAMYHVEPAVGHCTTRVMGPAGDSTAGGVWLAWSFEQQGGVPFHSRANLTAAPDGERFWQPEWWSQTLTYVPIWALTTFTNAPCAYNLSVVSGFVLSGLSMVVLVWWLTRRPVVAVMLGYAYAYSAFAQVKAAGHLAYVHREFIPLLILCALRFGERPTPRRSIELGITFAALSYVDGYYLLFGSICAATLVAVQLLARAHAERRIAALWPPIRALVPGAIVAAVALAPLVFAYAANRSSVSSAVSRPIGDLETYGARPGDYLLPARSHPIFDSFFGGWQDRHLGGSNYSEKTLFLGWTTIVLALVAVVAAAILGYRRARSGNRDPSPRWRLIGRGHVTELAVVALVAALVSGPGHFHFLGQTVPGPSRVIYAVAPYWRVFSRLFVVVHAAAIALAAIALTIAAHRFKPVAYRAILVIVALGVFVDAMAGTPFRYAYFDYDAAPSGYRWIATQEGVDVVADYPVYPTTLAPDASFATFQPIHGKRLVNPKASPDEGSLINSSVLGLSDPQTVPLLRALGVDLVVVHRGLYSIRPPQGPPPELLLQRESSFVQDAQTILTPDQARRHSYLASWYDMEIYSIASGPAAEVAALPSTGWSWPELNGWATERWMLDHGVVEVMRLRGEATRATVSMSFVAFLAPRNVIISQNGVVLADVDVSSSERTTVTVRAEVGAPLEITPTAPSTRVSDAIPGSPDGRELSVRLLEIDASPSTS